MDPRYQAKQRIAARAALEIFPGARVNVGIGIATLVPGFVPPEMDVWIHSENGFLGMGPAAQGAEQDWDLIDAGGRYVSLNPGGSYFDSATSFAIVRGGRLDISFLGAFEVDVRGNLANWRVPGRTTPGIGGAMELAQKVARVVVTSTHTAAGKAKLKTRCSLPLTASSSVKLVVTELAVLEPAGEAFRVLELAPGVSADEVRDKTEAPLLGLDEVRPWKETRARDGQRHP